MEWLNYHHLLYFWTVAREGTIAAACRKLQLAQPTISAQIRSLEDSLGAKLFARSGRNLVLTDTGRTVYRYAEEIFTLGQELQDVMKGRPAGSPLRLNVGIADVVPKLVAHRFFEPVLDFEDPVQLVCYEGKPADLLGRLAVHELDLVLTDGPMGPDTHVRAFHHEVGSCGITIFGKGVAVRKYQGTFPQSLDLAPFLLPTSNTAMRRALDTWFEQIGVRPRVVGEFEDSALLKVFAQSGAGLFAAPSVIAAEISRQYGVKAVGQTDDVVERFYAISVERKVRHPAVRSLVDAAKSGLFARENSPATRSNRKRR